MGYFQDILPHLQTKNMGFKCAIQTANPEHSVCNHQTTAKMRKIRASLGSGEGGSISICSNKSSSRQISYLVVFMRTVSHSGTQQKCCTFVCENKICSPQSVYLPISLTLPTPHPADWNSENSVTKQKASTEQLQKFKQKNCVVFRSPQQHSRPVATKNVSVFVGFIFSFFSKPKHWVTIKALRWMGQFLNHASLISPHTILSQCINTGANDLSALLLSSKMVCPF